MKTDGKIYNKTIFPDAHSEEYFGKILMSNIIQEGDFNIPKGWVVDLRQRWDEKPQFVAYRIDNAELWVAARNLSDLYKSIQKAEFMDKILEETNSYPIQEETYMRLMGKLHDFLEANYEGEE